jgi:hypothetical protein
LNDCSCVQAKGVTVIAVKSGGEGTSALISEIVCQWLKITLKILPFSQFLLHQINNQFLCFDFSHLHITVRIAIKQKLVCDFYGKEIKERLGTLGQLFIGKVFNLVWVTVKTNKNFVDF